MFEKITNGLTLTSDKVSKNRKLFVVLFTALLGLGASYLIPEFNKYQSFLWFLTSIVVAFMGGNMIEHGSTAYTNKWVNQANISQRPLSGDGKGDGA